MKFEPYIAPHFRLSISKPGYVDFRPVWAPMELPVHDQSWKEQDLIITVPIRITLERAEREISLNRITLVVDSLNRAKTFNWSWKANVSEFGKGFLGQYEDASPQDLAPGKTLSFGAQFSATARQNRTAWREFHDLILGSPGGKLEIAMTYEFSEAKVERRLEIAVHQIQGLFSEYDQNGFGLTRFIQPSVL